MPALVVPMALNPAFSRNLALPAFQALGRRSTGAPWWNALNAFAFRS